MNAEPLVIPQDERGEDIVRALDAIDNRLTREAQAESGAAA